MNTQIDIKNLSSRKLLELLASGQPSHQVRFAITRELRQRHHYLPELGDAPPPRRH